MARFSSSRDLVAFVMGHSDGSLGKNTGLTLPEFVTKLTRGFIAATGWVRWNNVSAPLGVMAPSPESRALPVDQRPPLAPLTADTPGAEAVVRTRDGKTETVYQWRSLVDTIGQEFGLDREDALDALDALARFDSARFRWEPRDQDYGPNSVDRDGNPRDGSYPTGTLTVLGLNRQLTPALLNAMMGEPIARK